MTSVLNEMHLRVLDGLEDDLVAESVKLGCRKELKQIRSDLIALDRAGEQKRFVHQRIEQAVDAFPEERERDLCTCEDDYCDLKQGGLPFEVRNADSIHDGIREFRKQHPGSPLVLDDALEAWNEREAAVVDTLELLHIALAEDIHPEKVRRATEDATADGSAGEDGREDGVEAVADD